MNQLLQCKSTILPLFIAGVLACFALSPKAQAVVPAPDGGYPGGNTAEGQAALLNLSTGGFNTALGFLSLRSDTTGQLNTAVGAGTLLANTADNNTAIGAAALLSNTVGVANTATGAFALFANATGVANTATGYAALSDNTEGNRNTALGNTSLNRNTTGDDNTAVGALALFASMGDRNTATGSGALSNNTTGVNNTANGFEAHRSNTTGILNTAVGFRALFSSTTNDSNTAIGAGALSSNTTGGRNTAVGEEALEGNITGNSNTALGFLVGNNVSTADNVICIGAGVSGQDVSNSCYIGNIWQQPGGTQAVYVNSDGKLGAQVSSQRFKEEIRPMEQASEVIYGLKPVSFRYKKQIEPTRPLGFGLIAEDVEKISPNLVTRDGDGQLISVRYDAVNAMLLNEFLKEHRKNEKLEAAVAEQQKQIEALTAGLQKVSAQLELSKPAPQTVNNP